MSITIHRDIEQGTEAWARLRCGIPTASGFSKILAKGEGKVRSKYMRQIAGEILSGEPMETYTNSHMERGKIMEDEARLYYAIVTGSDPERVGFIRNGSAGCSPDSLIGENKMLEIKTALPDIQIEALLRDDEPPEHKAQCQGNLWLGERETMDLMVYWPKMPKCIKLIPRDEAYIKTLKIAVSDFCDELNDLVEKLRRMQ